MDILFVTPYVPSRIRTRPYNLIRALIKLGHQVTLLAAAGASVDEWEQAEELSDAGVRVETFPVSMLRSMGNCLQALPTREPLQAAFSYHPDWDRRLRELSSEGCCDVVHVEHLRAARLLSAVADLPLVYDSVDCISLLFEQTARRGSQLRSRLLAAADLARTRRYEAQILTRCDQVVVTSRRDAEALKKLASRYLSPSSTRAPVTVITNGVDLEYFCPPGPCRARDRRRG